MKCPSISYRSPYKNRIFVCLSCLICLPANYSGLIIKFNEWIVLSNYKVIWLHIDCFPIKIVTRRAEIWAFSKLTYSNWRQGICNIIILCCGWCRSIHFNRFIWIFTVWYNQKIWKISRMNCRCRLCSDCTRDSNCIVTYVWIARCIPRCILAR
jgi:hypothetical protein